MARTRGKVDATALLRHILCGTDDLALDEAQFRSLSEIYFREGDAPRLLEIESFITPKQMRTAIRATLLAEPVALAASRATADEDAGAASIRKIRRR